MMGSWKGRGNQYIQLVKVLYCKLPANGKQLPAFQLEVRLGTKLRSQRWEARVLSLCHRGPNRPLQPQISHVIDEFLLARIDSACGEFPEPVEFRALYTLFRQF